MTDISTRCLVSGADGHVSVTPAGRIILTESAPILRGEDLDRIADDVGSDVALRTLAANGGTAAVIADVDGRTSITMTGRVAALIELPTANWFFMMAFIRCSNTLSMFASKCFCCASNF